MSRGRSAATWSGFAWVVAIGWSPHTQFKRVPLLKHATCNEVKENLSDAMEGLRPTLALQRAAVLKAFLNGTPRITHL